MPGRRSPRRPYEAAQSIHLQAAFPGGLSGSTTVPYPSRRDSGWNVPGKTVQEVCFYHEEFVLSSSSQQLMLTYLPIPYSEHLYLCRGGGVSGTYQRQGPGWTRDSGKRDLQVLPGMGASAGDIVVVEYAYYPQAPAEQVQPTKIWWTFESVSGENSGTLGAVAAGTLSGPTGAAPSLAPGSAGAIMLGPYAAVRTDTLTGGQLGGTTPTSFPRDIETDFWITLPRGRSPGNYAAQGDYASIVGMRVSVPWWQAPIWWITARANGTMSLCFGRNANDDITEVTVPVRDGEALHVQTSLSWDVAEDEYLPGYETSGTDGLIGCSGTLLVNGTSASAQYTDRPRREWAYGSIFEVQNAEGPGSLTIDEMRVDWSTYMKFTEDT